MRKTDLPISVCIMVLNEEDRLDRCLSRIKGFAETVVLDTGSTDRSIEVCRKYGVEVHETLWEGYGRSRKKLFSLATQPWILWLDADELITDELMRELESLFSKPIPFDAFEINLIVSFQGKWIRHGDWFPGRHIRLFKQGAWSMEDREVHESLRINGKVGRLHGLIEHYSYRNWADRENRSQKYAALWAKQMHMQGKRTTLVTPFLRGAWKFFRGYILRRGFLDGMLGARIAFSNAKEVVLKYKLLRELTGNR